MSCYQKYQIAKWQLHLAVGIPPCGWACALAEGG